MVKGKAQLNSREDIPPPQTRSLRSRKREHQSDEAPETDNVPAALHQKENEEDVTGIVASLLESLLQECAAVTNQQNQAAEQICFKKVEKHAETSKVKTNMAATRQEVETFTSSNNHSRLESCGLHTSNDTQKSRKNKEETTSETSNISPNQTPADQLQVILPISEDAAESCAAALENQVDGEENSSLERNQDISKDQSSTISLNDVKEPAVALPAKKKRRMGMCGLTEKKWSQFLQAQKHENGLNRGEKVENLIHNETADFMILEEDSSSTLPPSPLCIKAGCITDQSEAELKLQSGPCGENDRVETEIHFTVTTSDGTGTSEVDTVSVTEPTANPESCQLVEKDEEEGLVENLDMPELKEPTAENLAEMCKTQIKKMEEGPTEAHLSSAITCHRSQKEEPNNQNAVKAALPQMIGTTVTDDRKEEVTGAANCNAADTKSRGPNCDSVELCEAAVTPGVPEKENNCDLDEPAVGTTTVNAEHTQTRNPDDTFGSGCIDYVSDSQLNTIILKTQKSLRQALLGM
ncbi:uncharacterized protein LOC121637708 isoform X2 [Melanotaenia boesemani]|uniref:uncharacterized protein LOC121637708 isoform X2 n=1 Tax=Melanotaenia boesemani TaxID=1250792 RepID=UPI001C05D310|nr:uncharacterized protein LOC121637708 isoform X2 [Melanotaenia boesemani]